MKRCLPNKLRRKHRSNRYRKIELALAAAGEFNRLVAMQGGRITSVPIAEVANQQRLIPRDDPLLRACKATGATFGE